MRNVADHRVDAYGVFTSGADVGALAMLLATAFPALIAPLVHADVDQWTFFKAASSVLLSGAVVDPPTGFEAGPVLVGLGVHLLLGALIGGCFALAVAYFDLGEIVPILVVMISFFGAFSYIFVWVPISKTILPALDAVPIMFSGWMIVSFAILLGVGVGRWRSRWDATQCPHSRSERTRWMFTLHEGAIVATLGTLMAVVAGLAVVGADGIRWVVAVPLLTVHVLAAGVMVLHAWREHRELDGARQRFGRAPMG